MPFLSKIFQIIRNLSDFDILALVIFIVVCFHLKQINQSDEIVFLTNRNLNRNCIFTQTINNRLY